FRRILFCSSRTAFKLSPHLLRNIDIMIACTYRPRDASRGDSIRDRDQRGLGKPETFNFLGFTLICGKSRRGSFMIHRKTRRDRMKVKLKEVKGELRRRMHRPIPEQGKWLKQVITGFYAYHAVPTNFRALLRFRAHIKDLWLRTLRRRSQKDQTNWERITKLADDFLPQPRILHPWPNQRFAVTHPRWAPYAGKLHVRCCAGGAQ